MKIYTFFTSSHQKLYERFLNNFPYSTDIELVVKWFPQECENGTYMANGWLSTMKRKVQYIIQSLEETEEDGWFVHADCDIVLFPEWNHILNDNTDDSDMLIQNDHTSLCAGFFFCKSNTRTKKLWNLVLENLHNFEHDQAAMNYFIPRVEGFRASILPDSYFTYGFYKKGVWNGEDFTVPNIGDLRMFHANWTAGVDNKIKLIDKVLADKSFLQSK